LFELALRRYGERRVTGLTEALDRPGPARERLRAALERMVREPDRRGCLAVNSAAEVGAGDPAVNGTVRGIFDRMESAFRAAVEDGQRNGEIDTSRDAGEIASLLLNATIGMSVIAKTGEPERLSRTLDAVMASI
jgi:TetR/AcrR family transcriptional repressor of nem operon